MTSTSGVWIIVPAFNEESILPAVLAGLTKLPYDVVVVDDGSSDETARCARRFPVTVLRHACNLGQGAALATGIEWALSLQSTSFLVTFDSDGQHAPEDVERLLDAVRSGECDVALGSRFLRGGSAQGLPSLRRAVLKAGVAFTRWTTGLDVTDSHNGLRAFTAAAARRLHITQNRMAHASEILTQIASEALRVREVPVSIRYTPYSRGKGQSILGAIDILWDTIRGRSR